MNVLLSRRLQIFWLKTWCFEATCTVASSGHLDDTSKDTCRLPLGGMLSLCETLHQQFWVSYPFKYINTKIIETINSGCIGQFFFTICSKLGAFSWHFHNTTLGTLGTKRDSAIRRVSVSWRMFWGMPSSRHLRQFVVTLTFISFTGAGPSWVTFGNLFSSFGKIFFFPLFLDDPSPLG